MNKYIFLFLFSCIFLAGCKHTPESPSLPLVIEPIIKQPSEPILPPDTGTYPNPQISIFIGTGLDFNHLYEENTPDISGYLYKYTYKDLGIRIITSANYEPYFYTRTTGAILKRYKNIIYNAKGPVWGDHIGILTKDVNVSFEKQIKEQHVPVGCIIETGILDRTNAYYPSMVGFNVIYISSTDHNLVGDEQCHVDKEFPRNDGFVSFVMDPKHPEKYYKIGISDGCAPGPCSIFGKIEFF